MTDETNKNPDDNGLAARVAELEGQLAKSQTELEKARNQAAKYRVSRGQALRERHALGQVLKAHKITYDVAEADLDGLVIGDGGTVTGEFSYQPPATTKGSAPADPPGEATKTLTVKDVQGMSRESMKQNWKAVMEAIEADSSGKPTGAYIV